MGQQYQRLTVHLGDKRHFDLYRTGLFAVTRIEGAPQENHFWVTTRKRAVLAAGRMVDAGTLRISRGAMPVKQLRELLDKAGYNMKVVSGKQRSR